MLASATIARWLVPASLLALTSGCYLAHTRDEPGSPADAGRDAWRAHDAASTDVLGDRSFADRDWPDTGTECVPRTEMAQITPTLRMDITEVTQGDYARFLRCAPGAPGPLACPASAHQPCAEEFHPETSPWVPVTCMSWCDAASYCAWAGRRLCTLAELLPACEAAAARVSVGGSVWRADSCVMSGWDDGAWGAPAPPPQDVGSAPGCVASGPPYDVIQDLVGNAEEIVAGCDRGDCFRFGADVASGPWMPCGPEGTYRPDEPLPLGGFRCCAD